jgi:hypothetical protein
VIREPLKIFCRNAAEDGAEVRSVIGYGTLCAWSQKVMTRCATIGVALSRESRVAREERACSNRNWKSKNDRAAYSHCC